MKGFSATPIVIFSVLVLVSANTSQFAFADGDDSPAACLSSNANVFSDMSGGTTTVDAGAGNIISSICIKDGTGSFDDPASSDPADKLKHSQVITANGNYGINSCYVVSGFPNMQMVTVTDDCGGMMAVSHVDYTVEPGDMVGGHGGITDNTALLVSGSHLTASWMIPLLVSAIGIGVFIVTRK